MVTSINDLFWTFLGTFFGGSENSENLERNSKIHNIILIICLLMGNISWITYGAVLTSELAIPSETKPFEDLEGLSKSSYHLNTIEKPTAYAAYFHQAVQGTIPHKVYRNNMDDQDSFNSLQDSVSIVLENSDQALFAPKNFIKTIENYKCILRLLGKGQPLWSRSMGVRKNSPYTEFFNIRLLQSRETGAFSLIDRAEFLSKGTVCKEKNLALSFKKVAFPFLMLSIGIILGIILLPLEVILTRVIK